MKTLTSQGMAVLTTFLLLFVSASSQSSKLITGRAAGNVRLGMTVAQVRKAVAPAKLVRTSDGEGVALIAVKRGAKTVMTLYAGEPDPAARLDPAAKVEQIWVWDKTYRTAGHVSPGDLLSKAAKVYGGVKKIQTSEIESREFVEFVRDPAGLSLRLENGSGIFPPGSRETTSYKAGSRIFSINVVGVSRSNQETGGSKPFFSSEFTSLKTGCKTTEPDPGGHVSTFCKGPKGYQVHYFDAATFFQLDVADSKRDWEKGVANFGLDELKNAQAVEWRLANGVPFAAIFTDPGSGKVFVQGLKGFDRVTLEDQGPDSRDRARLTADDRYAEMQIPAVPIIFPPNSTKTVVKGRIPKLGDKLKYVVHARAGEKLTVTTAADKWTGDEGPILVVSVRMPDGTEDGEPGGLWKIPTQDGDHEITITQNRAKSAATNIEVTVTITLAPNGT